MGSVLDDAIGYREDDDEIDFEWLELILAARELGLVPEEVRKFLSMRSQAV